MTRLAITAGEPSGIGPDLCVTLAQSPQLLDSPQSAQLVVLADPDLLQERAALLGLPLKLRVFDPNEAPQAADPGELWVMPHRLAAQCQPGQLNPANARYVLETLTSACQGCQSGIFDAMVTAPVHKGVINDAGIPFSGHTEFLADLTQTELVVMMLATEGLRVALVTTHLPLREIADAITPERLEKISRILHRDLVEKFGLEAPRILVCGLNPHAGEGGHLGREELDIIIPTLERLRSEGLDLQGPLPADTLFTPLHLEQGDAVLAMYHDQGLPVLKHKGFGQAVNITLGLPIIRTSVDHGTALDLAGTGKAHIGSLETAIKYALEMSCAQ